LIDITKFWFENVEAFPLSGDELMDGQITPNVYHDSTLRI
jgi:hypothetical protein